MSRLSSKSTSACFAMVAALTLLGCGSSADDAEGNDSGSGGSGSQSNGTANTGGSAGEGNGSNGNGNTVNTTTGGPPILPTVPGDPDPDAPDTALPELPALVNVKAVATDDSAEISFDPIHGAIDYRVYELPRDEDITVDDDGHLSIQNALYRCSGTRPLKPLGIDGEDIDINGEPIEGGVFVWSIVEGNAFGYERTLEDATLGYVYATPGDDRVPVYALGESGADSDSDCNGRYQASRVKRYVISEADRDSMLADGYRDEGIAFYVPADQEDTIGVFTTTDQLGRFYYTDGPEADVRGEGTEDFYVMDSEADGSVPLMRVHYDVTCGANHDELVPGMGNFERIRSQGDDNALPHVHWSGLEDDTILVVEALATGCPDRVPGVMAPESREPYTAEFSGFEVPYEAWLTLDEVTALSDIGDTYVNGQFAEDSRPIPIARSFVRIGPGPRPDFDWFSGFGEDDSLGDLEETNCGARDGNCFQNFRFASDEVDVSFYYAETERFAFGTMLDELWVTFADGAADTNGKFRLTPTTSGEVTSDSYLYVTMDVDALTTGRRYPQLLVSDQPAPVHHNMPDGNTLVLQTFGEFPPILELQVCDHRYWEVNYQCPRFNFHHYFDDSGAVTGIAPHDELDEYIGVDRPTRFEAYISSERAYVFLEGKPYGCADLPDAGVPSGEVSVTFGDVLYHSGVDDLKYYDYYRDTLQVVARRHFDNLGFKSGVPAPGWDESRFPCTSGLYEASR